MVVAANAVAGTRTSAEAAAAALREKCCIVSLLSVICQEFSPTAPDFWHVSHPSLTHRERFVGNRRPALVSPHHPFLECAVPCPPSPPCPCWPSPPPPPSARAPRGPTACSARARPTAWSGWAATT